MAYISDILYWISTGLLVPVVIVLIFLFVRALLLLGSFFGQYMTIRRTDALLRDKVKTLTPAGLADFEAALPKQSRSLVVVYMHELLAAQDSDATMRRLLADFEIAADSDLGTSKTLAKLGPMVGLMGTLIPMGPALVGLAQGDIASMAYNMQVAFATTVVGLFSAAIGFVTQQTKQRWYLQDATNLEFVYNIIRSNEGGRS